MIEEKYGAKVYSIITEKVCMEYFLEKIASKYGIAKQYLMAIGVTGEEIERIRDQQI